MRPDFVWKSRDLSPSKEEPMEKNKVESPEEFVVSWKGRCRGTKLPSGVGVTEKEENGSEGDVHFPGERGKKLSSRRRGDTIQRASLKKKTAIPR